MVKDHLTDWLHGTVLLLLVVNPEVLQMIFASIFYFFLVSSCCFWSGRGEGEGFVLLFL